MRILRLCKRMEMLTSPLPSWTNPLWRVRNLWLQEQDNNCNYCSEQMIGSPWKRMMQDIFDSCCMHNADSTHLDMKMHCSLTINVNSWPENLQLDGFQGEWIKCGPVATDTDFTGLWVPDQTTNNTEVWNSMSYVISTNQSLVRPHADLNFAASDVESAADLL